MESNREKSPEVTADYLFTYGTFRHPYVQEKIFGHTIAGEEAILEGHAVNSAGTYYDIIEKTGSSVNGVVLPVTEEDLDCADIWEDVPLYSRCCKKVRLKDRFVTAVVYVKTQKTEPFIELTDYASLTQLPDEKLKREIDACVAAHPALQRNESKLH